MTTAAPLTGAATGWQQFVTDERERGTEANQLWHQILANGLPFLLERQAENTKLGANDACVYCYRPFGPHLRRNRLNRYYCDDCDTFTRTTPGQAKLIMPTLVVDIRDSTGISQRMGADWVPAIRRFRRNVGRAVQEHYGFVMNTAGDSLMAIFPPGFLPAAEREHTNAAAEALKVAEILASRSPETDAGGDLPYGTAVHTSEMVIFSVRGDDDDLSFADEGGDPSWSPPPEVSGPVSIDMAGDAIVVACEWADAAGPREALISEDSDRHAGLDTAAFAYEKRQTKTGPVKVRSLFS